MLSLACGLWGDGSCFAKQIFVVSAAVSLALVQLCCFHEWHGMQLNRLSPRPVVALASVSQEGLHHSCPTIQSGI